MTKKCLLTLVSGGSYAQREAAIAASLPKLHDDETIAVVLEGLPGGNNILSESILHVHRIAPGCMCCIGNLAMRVTLNRIFRLSPSYLFVSLSDVEHLETVKLFLQQPAYANLLQLDQNLQLTA
jgi:G3E family GTPase